MKALLIFLARLLLKAALDKCLEKALPSIYEKLDVKIPEALSNGFAPKVVESEIKEVISEVTGQAATKEMIDLVITFYDPVQNAIRTQHSK